MGEAWSNQLVSLIIIAAGGGFTGLFMYSPAPGPGNLVTSIAPQAGVDPFGNAYPAGITEGKTGKVQAQLFANPATGIGILQYLYNDARFTNSEVLGAVQGSPAFADLALIGPASTNPAFDDHIEFALNSSDAISSSANLVQFYVSTSNVLFIFFAIDCGGVQIRACSQLTATDPTTGTTATPAQSETWHDLRPLQNSFIGTISGRYPPQYRKLADGNIQIEGFIQCPNIANPNSITFATLPAVYRPTANTGQKWACVDETNVTPVGTGCVQVDTAGNLQLHNWPSTGMNNNIIDISGIYPLDNTGLIQS